MSADALGATVAADTTAAVCAEGVRVRDVFRVLFSACDGLVELRALPSERRAFCQPDDVHAIAAFVQAHRTEHLFFGVATRKDSSSGKLENCLDLQALFTDFDFKHCASPGDAQTRLASFPLRPTIVIESGGGLHCYWSLKEPIPPHTAKPVLRRLALALGGDMAAAEGARVLRVPNTFNCKPEYGEPRRVRVRTFDPSAQYNPGDFEELLPTEPEAELASTPHIVPNAIPAGQRNDLLYKTVRALVAKGLTATAIEAAVLATNAERCQPPLPEAEVRALVAHATTQTDRPGFERRPIRPTVSTAAHATAPAAASWRWLGNVRREYVAWLWRTRLAYGTLTLWIGDGGLGKSRATDDVAARVTIGADWPDGGRAERGTVIILNAEDSPSYTIRPAIEAAGGDVNRVALLDAVRDDQGVERTFQLSTDIAALDALIVETGATLVIIDPLSAYFGTKLDSYRDTDVRAVLAPVVKLAERRRVAILGMMHIGKATDRRASHRVLGSVAFTNAARLVFAIGPDPEDPERRLLVPVKANLCREAATLAFRLEDANGVARVVWETAPVEHVTAEAVLAGKPVFNDEDQQDAVRVIRVLLEEEEWPLDAKVALAAGRACGIHDRTLRRAARKLGIEVRKSSFQSGWRWYKPDPPRTDGGNGTVH